jgi:hypothetical protein
MRRTSLVTGRFDIGNKYSSDYLRSALTQEQYSSLSDATLTKGTTLQATQEKLFHRLLAATLSLSNSFNSSITLPATSPQLCYSATLSKGTTLQATREQLFDQLLAATVSLSNSLGSSCSSDAPTALLLRDSDKANNSSSHIGSKSSTNCLRQLSH